MADGAGISGELPNAKGIVIICPGGGYEWLSPREARPVAAAFGRNGWESAVLYYAVGHDLGTGPLEQLGEAVRLIREALPGMPVVVCGFSAGGHLAASLGVHWNTMGLERPDALILCYPVITAGEYAHCASMRNLIRGQMQDIPSQNLARGQMQDSLSRNLIFFSLERHVTSDMPPAFIWHTAADPEVPVQNSLLLAEAMAKAEVPFELLIYPKGVHGLSLATPEVEEPEKGRYADAQVAGWFRLCLEWLDLLSLRGFPDQSAFPDGRSYLSGRNQSGVNQEKQRSKQR